MCLRNLPCWNSYLQNILKPFSTAYSKPSPAVTMPIQNPTPNTISEYNIAIITTTTPTPPTL